MNEHATIDHAKRAQTMPIEDINVSDPRLYQDDVWMHYFDRLRREAPVHYCKDSPLGSFWSVTRYKDIVAIEVNHKVFSSSSQYGGITLRDRTGDLELPMFIAMDQPRHDEQRKIVQPIVSPANLANFEGLIRKRIQKTLDELPRGEAFDWVDKVSIELTGQMLATLFDFPFEQRRKLTYWSDVTTTDLASPDRLVNSEEEREQVFGECLVAFTKLWNERVNSKDEGQGDLISMLVHGEATRNMNPREYLGNVLLLIVGGNDTTRNSMSSSVWFFNQYPDQYAKLRANPDLMDSAVSEVIRFHTPLSHMRRTALADTEIGGKTIRKGEKVAMWYISGNRDDSVIENPNTFIIDRERPRQHLSFGFGIHRCVGNRLAELQLKILWQEILARDLKIEVLAPPKRLFSAFVHGITELKVRIAP
ncbi:MAG: cytochrome P450 [Rhodoblastus sp.]